MRDTNRIYERGWIVVLVCVAGQAFVMVFRISSAARAQNAVNAQQEAIRLESRINQLEQRLYSMETSLRTLETRSQIGNVSSRDVTQQNLSVLTSTMQAFQLRLADDECALAKLDERTLSPAMRQARQRSSGTRTGCGFPPIWYMPPSYM